MSVRVADEKLTWTSGPFVFCRRSWYFLMRALKSSLMRIWFCFVRCLTTSFCFISPGRVAAARAVSINRLTASDTAG